MTMTEARYLMQCQTHNDLGEPDPYSFGLWCPGSKPTSEEIAMIRAAYQVMPDLFYHCVEVHGRDGECPSPTQDKGCSFRSILVSLAPEAL